MTSTQTFFLKTVLQWAIESYLLFCFSNFIDDTHDPTSLRIE